MKKFTIGQRWISEAEPELGLGILNKLTDAEDQKNEFLCEFYGYDCGGYIQRINKINDLNKQKEDFNKILQHIETIAEFDDLMNNFKYDLIYTRGKIPDFDFKFNDCLISSYDGETPSFFNFSLI